jgi:Domain of unknown function (DUF4202)
MSLLLPRAREWISEVHPHARHLLRTEAWLLELEPEAGEGLRLAAVLHDIERAFPDPAASWDSARDWDSREYNRWHQDRCADIAARWLREQGAPAAQVDEVEALIRVHEEGGWREADLLQAADSLSFLETMVGLVVGWVDSGRAPVERAEGKLRNSTERMAPGLERARELGAPMLAEGLEAVARAAEGAAP